MADIKEIRNHFWRDLNSRKSRRPANRDIKQVFNELLVVEMLVSASQEYAQQRWDAQDAKMQKILGIVERFKEMLEIESAQILSEDSQIEEFEESIDRHIDDMACHLALLDDNVSNVASRLDVIETNIGLILSHFAPPPADVATSISFGWGKDRNTYPIEKEIQMTDVGSFTDSSAGEDGVLSLADAEGVTIVPTTPPVWTETDASFATLTVAADGLSASAVPILPVTAPLPATSDVTITITNTDDTTFTATTSYTMTAGAVTAADVKWSPIVVTPPPVSTVVVDPASSLPLYFAVDGGTVDPAYTAVTDVTDEAGATLYTFSGDTVGADPTGVTASYVAFVGTPTPVVVTPPTA